MKRPTRPSAFTLIELLVVVAIISLLMSILLPSLTRAKRQSKAAVCMSNMRQIGYLLLAYCNDDRTAQIIPIHDMMIRPTGNFWIATTGHSFVWGGRDAQHALPDETGDIRLSGDEHGYVPPGMSGPPYGAAHRPLNRYYLGADFTTRDALEMPVFRCPEDTGFSDQSVTVPPSARGVPCYDLFGNSYQAQTMTSFIDDRAGPGGAFSWGAWGHRLHTIPTPGQIVLVAEPPFFDAGGTDWHGRGHKVNVMFVDGGTRVASTQMYPPPDDGTLVKMDLPLPSQACNSALIIQGQGWRLDTWPTPGARIWGPPSLWTDEVPPFSSNAIPACLDRLKWPFPGYERNLE